MQTLSSAPLFELVRLGRDALETALCIFRALDDENGMQTAQTVLNKLEGKPLSLKELAVSGNDLKPLFAVQNRPMREMGRVLDQLWQAVIEEDVPNEREALLGHPVLKG